MFEKKEQRRILIFVIIFALGFLASYLLYAQPREWQEKPSVIQAENIEIVPLLDRQYFNTSLTIINSAQQSIDIAMFEFKFYENEKNKVRQLTEALIDASQRGVNVRVLLDASNWNPSITRENLKTVDYLKEHGINAKLDNPKKTLHAKLILADDIVIVGSTNLGFHAVERNNEANVVIKSVEGAEYYRDYFEMLW